ERACRRALSSLAWRLCQSRKAARRCAAAAARPLRCRQQGRLPGDRRQLARDLEGASRFGSGEPCPALPGVSMFSFLARGFASLSLALKQPLTAFCELETAHDDALITKTGQYLSWIRVDGMQRMAERKDFVEMTEAVRLYLSRALATRGHDIVGWDI